ncbi:MAG: hypothetical protein IPL35_13335 [Sphingobacteriales bacterium]|nr:hypothetical protein [Sphingobacteriales bacterium]
MRRTCIFIFCFLLLNSANLRAQNHFSLTGNISAFSIDKVQSDANVADVTYEGSSSVSLNLRLFNANHWALRFGVGADNVKFRVADQLNTDYDSERKDFIGIIGIEKHFPLSETVTLYPGFIVPLTLKGDESIKSNIDNSIAQLKDDGFLPEQAWYWEQIFVF